MELLEALKTVGMNENKARVYLACLELGSATATKVATKAHIHRTTVYEILKDLGAEGLVYSTPRGRATLFVPERPDHLKTLLKEKEKKVDDILPDLRSRFNKKDGAPRVRFYEGAHGVRTMFTDTLSAHDTTLRALLSVSDFYAFLGKDWFDDYTKKRIASGKKLLVIRPENKEVGGVFPSSQEDKREVRLAPRDMNFSLSQYLYDDKVVLISTIKEGYGMIIESKEYHTTQLQLFETLWSVSRITKKA